MSRNTTFAFLLGVFIMAGFCKIGNAQEVVPPTSKEEFQVYQERVINGELASAIFAGGCFWCTESFFIEEEGVLAVQVGYTGGHVDDPTYEQVTGKKTGHAEGLEVIFDPQKTTYQRMLDVFFESHDPTQLNRQGPDIGPQYRSAIFYQNDTQEKLAKQQIAKINQSGKYNSPVVTELNEAQKFFRAEDYHQRYYWDRGVDRERLKKSKGY